MCPWRPSNNKWLTFDQCKWYLRNNLPFCVRNNYFLPLSLPDYSNCSIQLNFRELNKGGTFGFPWLFPIQIAWLRKERCNWKSKMTAMPFSSIELLIILILKKHLFNPISLFDIFWCWIPFILVYMSFVSLYGECFNILHNIYLNELFILSQRTIALPSWRCGSTEDELRRENRMPIG